MLCRLSLFLIISAPIIGFLNGCYPPPHFKGTPIWQKEAASRPDNTSGQILANLIFNCSPPVSNNNASKILPNRILSSTNLTSMGVKNACVFD